MALAVAVRASSPARVGRGARRAIARAVIDDGLRSAGTGHRHRPASAAAAVPLRQRRLRYDARAAGAGLGALLARPGDSFEVRTFVSDEVPRNLGRPLGRAV